MASYLSRKEFLEAIFLEYFSTHQGFIVVQSLKRLDPRTSTRFFPNIEKLVMEQYAFDQNVYFGVCPREGMKPGPEHVRFLTCLWAAIDLTPEGHSGRQGHFLGPAHAAKAVRSFPLPPSIIVESGWGLHMYWLTREIMAVTDPGRVESLLRNINEYFHCKARVGLDSTLRLPGTTNCKYPGQFLDCKIKYLNQNFRYDLEDFEKLDLAALKAQNVAARSAWKSPTQGAAATPQALAEKRTQEEDEVVEILEEYATKEWPLIKKASQEILDQNILPEADLSEETLDRLADKIASKISDKVSDKIAEKLLSGNFAEAIAGRVIARMAYKSREGRGRT